MSWLTRLLDTKVPIKTYADQAEGWGTCAIGEAHDAIPFVVTRRSFSNVPQDNRLFTLGKDFYTAVSRNQRPKALRIYLAIQRRIAELARIE